MQREHENTGLWEEFPEDGSASSSGQEDPFVTWWNSEVGGAGDEHADAMSLDEAGTEGGREPVDGMAMTGDGTEAVDACWACEELEACEEGSASGARRAETVLELRGTLVLDNGKEEATDLCVYALACCGAPELWWATCIAGQPELSGRSWSGIRYQGEDLSRFVPQGARKRRASGDPLVGGVVEQINEMALKAVDRECDSCSFELMLCYGDRVLIFSRGCA
ncbi:uncharacterized protein B0I36DRAFT_316310 [Microdochium trichocladiopsis]|uniref:Uncharacterized protein n=1 Tax=Microdochium trichocladiopsis TaxID=1682393 RepID=A0A9P9BT17_9PEZI|nr:uncharacterized protein B0I36DRAFT_316310 [Microdochium trichocladiopsis]KAH7038455.1 hypothetical protein B0I36DRAFT_316310 [Microdochium trichocladiopsis]